VDTALSTVIVTGVVVVADAYVPSDATVAVTEHVPDPLEIVTVLPLTVQAVEDPTEYVTDPLPNEAVADTTCVWR
jgi:hypothetical protein